MGFFKKIFKGANKFLGTGVGGIASDVLGGLWDDSRQRDNTKEHFEFLQSKGLTPWEIIGGGGGNAVRASGNTLGSGPTIQANEQRAFQADQAEKERLNKRVVADIQTGPAHKTADINMRMEPYRRDQTRATISKIKQDVKRGKIELENFWPILFAKMGPDNLMIAMGSLLEGVSPEQVLKSSGIPADAKTRQQMQNVAAWLTKYKGMSGGIQGLVKTGTDSVKDAANNILGGMRAK